MFVVRMDQNIGKLSAGSHVLSLRIDQPANSILECNELNNNRARTLNVLAKWRRLMAKKN